MASGEPPKSGIGKGILNNLSNRVDRDTGVAWVQGNPRELEGRQEGVLARCKAGFGPNITLWDYSSLAAYTWTRTDMGPQNAWLHRIKTAAHPGCPHCSHHTEGQDISRSGTLLGASGQTDLHTRRE